MESPAETLHFMRQQGRPATREAPKRMKSVRNLSRPRWTVRKQIFRILVWVWEAWEFSGEIAGVIGRFFRK
jgi:hypothetical protein